MLVGLYSNPPPQCSGGSSTIMKHLQFYGTWSRIYEYLLVEPLLKHMLADWLTFPTTKVNKTPMCKTVGFLDSSYINLHKHFPPFLPPHHPPEKIIQRHIIPAFTKGGNKEVEIQTPIKALAMPLPWPQWWGWQRRIDVCDICKDGSIKSLYWGWEPPTFNRESL